MIRYFAVFADDGHRIATYVADGMPYSVSDILTKYPDAVEVTAEEQKQYMQGYIRGIDGLPQKPMLNNGITAQEFEKMKIIKKNEIYDLARAKLMESDHDIVEYFELKNLSLEQFEQLKARRQKIRDYRNQLLFQIDSCTDPNALQCITFRY